MKRAFLLFICIGLAMLASSCGGFFGKGGVHRLKWLSGNWEGQTSTGTYIETWTWADNKLHGAAFRVSQGDTTFSETLRIEEFQGELYYITKVTDQQVWFKARSVSGREAIFENLNHDFPQRFIYTKKSNDELLVRAEGKEHGETKYLNFFFKRVH